MKHGFLLRISLIVFFGAGAATGQTRQNLPDIGEQKQISIAFSNDRVGVIKTADRGGKVRQYLEIWENLSKKPVLINYVLLTEQGSLSATWGMGPINPKMFSCVSGPIPEVAEKSYWNVSSRDGSLVFTETGDKDIKGLFNNIFHARIDWDHKVAALNKAIMANLTESNILLQLNEKSRKKWLDAGWLQPISSCVPHLY